MRIPITKFSTSEVVNNSIIKCYRQFHDDEADYPSSIANEERDGSIFIVLANKVIAFYADTENFSLNFDILDKEKIPEDAVDISDDQYWSLRVNRKIRKVEKVFGERENPYGIKLVLSDNTSVSILYLSESEYSFDCVVLRNE